MVPPKPPIRGRKFDQTENWSDQTESESDCIENWSDQTERLFARDEQRFGCVEN